MFHSLSLYILLIVLQFRVTRHIPASSLSSRYALLLCLQLGLSPSLRFSQHTPSTSYETLSRVSAPSLVMFTLTRIWLVPYPQMYVI